MQEKRATFRHSFGVEQRIAGLIDGQMPSPSDFETVRCIDISQDGIGFYQKTRPDYQELVVGLGIPPQVVYMTARVAHVEMIELCGTLVFRVGCEFTGRAEWDVPPETVLREGDVNDPFHFLTTHTPAQTDFSPVDDGLPSA